MRKQRYTIPIWAHNIRVEQKLGALIVRGERRHMSPARVTDLESDLLASCKPLVRWGEQRRKMPPHIEFANATTKDKLIEFVQKWGPVEGISKVICKSPSDEVLDVVADFKTNRLFVSLRTRAVEVETTQDLEELRREQQLFGGAARLIAEIQTEKPAPDMVFRHYSQLSESEDGEFFCRVVKGANHRSDLLASAACQRAQLGLCNLLDRFPVRLELTELGPVELAPLDAEHRIGGIRSILYFFLRLEYLRRGRMGIGVCPCCDEVFAKERRGAVFCGEDCSKKHRSAAYYNLYGRAKRQQRNRNKNS